MPCPLFMGLTVFQSLPIHSERLLPTANRNLARGGGSRRRLIQETAQPGCRAKLMPPSFKRGFLSESLPIV